MGKVKIISPEEAAGLLKDGDTFTTSGFVASCIPEALNKAVEQRFLETGHPRDLTYVYASCVAEGNVRLVTDEAERQAGMRAICEKYSGDWMDGPEHERVMRGMPAVVMLGMEVDAFQGKGNKGRLVEGL